MIAVKVQYTVKPEYVKQNKFNINRVMDALKSNPIKGMLYSSYTLQNDSQTFVHINIAKDEETLDKLNTVVEFQEFRNNLKNSNPISPPAQTNLDFVAAGFDI